MPQLAVSVSVLTQRAAAPAPQQLLSGVPEQPGAPPHRHIPIAHVSPRPMRQSTAQDPQWVTSPASE